MSSGFCTLGELKQAVHWMASEFDGSIDVVYRRNTDRGYMPFRPEDYVAAGSQVVIVMQKPGYDPRTVGIFRVIETAPEATAPLLQVGNKGVGRWVIMMRLALCSLGQPACHCD